MISRSAYPALMGHRGAAALAPENTLAGLAAAAANGCTWVEVDVMLSSDGIPVLHHDLSLRRTSGSAGRVDRTTWAELAKADVGAYFHARHRGETIPSLESALQRMQELGLLANLEIKPAPGQAEATALAAVATVRQVWRNRDEPPLFSSFSREALAAAKAEAPEFPRSLITDRLPRDWESYAEALDVISLHLNRERLTSDVVSRVKAAGYAFGIYTVNRPDAARTYRSWGADCIITDEPDVVLPAISARSR